MSASDTNVSRGLTCAILLGGFFGPDGWLGLNLGMHQLAARIELEFPGARVVQFGWNKYLDAELVLRTGARLDNRLVLIGYSGGGSRATWLANEFPLQRIDLLVAYDPSPAWQMRDLAHTNVRRGLTFENSSPLFFGLGGGKLTGGPGQVRVVPIAQLHGLVQFNFELHQQTVDAIRRIS